MSVYSDIASSNLKSNYRFFIPKISAESGLIACFYIAVTLTLDKRLAQIKGGSYLESLMAMGVGVLSLLSAVLIFYINSFLMKQRKREFGIYNAIGMEKKHIGKVLFHETFISSILSYIIGTVAGILFYKICSLLICKLLNTEIVAGFYYISFKTVLIPILFFFILDLLTYFVNLIIISKMKTIELISSKSSGEKEPKVKYIMLILGLLSLAGGYFISVTVKSPLEALLLFFVAVLLVVIGTYFVFISGSIFVLKLLKRNKKFYYNKNHITSVSGLLYRMKQNAVGLASISILATGVLVMISTTVSLYAGIKDTLDSNYPDDCYITTEYFERNENGELISSYIPIEKTDEIIENVANELNIEISKKEHQKYLQVAYRFEKGELITDNSENRADIENVASIRFITEENFCMLGGEKLDLAENEIAVCSIDTNAKCDFSELKDKNNVYKVKTEFSSFPIKTSFVSTGKNYGIVVANDKVINDIYLNQKEAYGENASEMTELSALTFKNSEDVIKTDGAFEEKVNGQIKEYLTSSGKEHFTLQRIDTKWLAKEGLYGLYGTFLFLGILLGAVCLFSTVLIIYYKQISEGYDDRERFQIMQKIGMSEAEVRETVDDQVKIVFFLPLLVALMHIIFAFPILERLLKILLLPSRLLFIKCTVIVFIVFAVVYTLIYKATVKTYCKIVK